jgi:nitrate/nitrite transport system substrate-binding protein
MTGKLEKTKLTIGFMLLTDCMLIAIAQEQGFFAKQGLDVTLSREPSWASLRDKMAFGALDGAHMLTPMLFAATLGLGTRPVPMVTGFSMGLNGNAITISKALHAELSEVDPKYDAHRPVLATAFRSVIAARKRANKPLLTFATVFPFSLHNYELRYWLADAGIHPDRDVRIIVVPPPQMADALAAGTIDGFCSGGPWNLAAVARDIGEVAVTGYEIWNNAPEKVFGVSEAWAREHPNTHLAVLRALMEASRWIDSHFQEAAAIVAAPAYLDVDTTIVEPSLRGQWRYRASDTPIDLPNYHVFHRYAANFPWVSHGIWILSQMCRWGEVAMDTDLAALAHAVYRPDIYRAAAAPLGLALPAADLKHEGTHGEEWTLDGVTLGADRFFDGRVFDPTRPLDYLEGFRVHSMQTPKPARSSAAG